MQLTQAGAGLIGIILHLRNTPLSDMQTIWNLAMQGLPVAIQVLRHLGNRVSVHGPSEEQVANDHSDPLASARPSFSPNSRAPAIYQYSPGTPILLWGSPLTYLCFAPYLDDRERWIKSAWKQARYKTLMIGWV